MIIVTILFVLNFAFNNPFSLYTQWNKYVGVLNRHSTRVVILPDESDCPDSHFVEDTAVLFRDEVAGEEVAVLCSNMAKPRRPEVKSMLKQLLGEEKQYDRIGHIDGDGEVRESAD